MICFPFSTAEGNTPCASAVKSKDVLKKLETYLPGSGRSVYFFVFHLFLVFELREKLFLTLMASGGQEKREMEGTKS